ncbi:hypothetical protein EDC90_101293 [Martelella mediterranea]|uniref:Uncharacterized protein n=1 Tax=Martelella mediterranea TaxID=293089 RepID=A0A4R3NY81_9HYPH|nr:hypothetical protein EDC90_101293 [Martelella mediterranea]
MVETRLKHKALAILSALAAGPSFFWTSWPALTFIRVSATTLTGSAFVLKSNRRSGLDMDFGFLNQISTCGRNA